MLQSAASLKDASSNPQAYDELKKRLLNEYKKLCNTKKTYEEAQPRYTPQANPKSSSSQVRQFEESAETNNQAHMNVYKPTFIINNSFQNEGGKDGANPSVTAPDHKKYMRGSGPSSATMLKQ